MPHTMKSVKVRREHHLALKAAAAEHDCSLQQYLAFLMELAFSEDPLLRDARNAYFHLISGQRESVMEMIKRLVPKDSA